MYTSLFPTVPYTKNLNSFFFIWRFQGGMNTINSNKAVCISVVDQKFLQAWSQIIFTIIISSNIVATFLNKILKIMLKNFILPVPLTHYSKTLPSSNVYTLDSRRINYNFTTHLRFHSVVPLATIPTHC